MGKCQKAVGVFSGLCLAIAMLALLDGLVARMRTVPEELNVLPGEKVLISGPAVIRKPVMGDLLARFTPADTSLEFTLEGFFSGYWFGNGMWRGYVNIPENSAPGQVELRIAFKGAPAQNTQKYIFNVYAENSSLREVSLSWVMRVCGANPFIVAAIAGGAGILAGMGTYFFGRRYYTLLRKLGLVEIQRKEANGVIWGLADKKFSRAIGVTCPVLTRNGEVIGKAVVKSWRKGALELVLEDASLSGASSLIDIGSVSVTEDKSPAYARSEYGKLS